MKRYQRGLSVFSALFIVVLLAAANISAQENPVVLSGAELTRVIPTSFFYAGQSAPTQVRNSGAVRVGKNHLVLAGLVDTSGYSTEIRGSYQGFFITESQVTIGTGVLPVGAYGFGFDSSGSFNVFNISGQKLMSAATSTDAKLTRPRPLMFVASRDGLRLYSGRQYVSISSASPTAKL